MVVLVTGSAKGIGASTIKEFASNGYDVIINYNKSEEEALKLKGYIDNNYNVRSLVIKCDIINESEIDNMINKIRSEFNNIDVLVNNASISLDNNIEDKTKEEFMKVLEVNVVGTFLVTRKVLDELNVKKVINISSTDGIDTYSKLNIDYSASKAGVDILTKTFALAYPNVKIYSVAPNWVKTESVLEMNNEYLRKEMNRVHQSKLIEVDEVSKQIYKLVNGNMESGTIVRIDGE